MSKLSRIGVVVFASLLSCLSWAPAARAEQVDQWAMSWQAVIYGQISAFRNHDAPTVLQLAGAEFRASFRDPAEFFVAIIGSGYAPLMESHGQSFGRYKMIGADAVLQDVTITGNDHVVYEAIYQLRKEPQGWRVLGVQLIKTDGIEV